MLVKQHLRNPAQFVLCALRPAQRPWTVAKIEVVSCHSRYGHRNISLTCWINMVTSRSWMQQIHQSDAIDAVDSRWPTDRPTNNRLTHTGLQEKDERNWVNSVQQVICQNGRCRVAQRSWRKFAIPSYAKYIACRLKGTTIVVLQTIGTTLHRIFYKWFALCHHWPFDVTLDYRDIDVCLLLREEGKCIRRLIQRTHDCCTDSQLGPNYYSKFGMRVVAADNECPTWLV